MLRKQTKAAREKQKNEVMDKLFERPLIHREIHGNKVFVPLDVKRLWKG